MRWKLTVVQHPMYMLIREDTQCAERTPPWGAPTIEAYIERVEQNLNALEQYPRLKLGYEWSAVELEMLAQDSPRVFDLLRTYSAEGRVQFYNGTYAQPHLQILSAESNFRQFQFGQQVYRELGLSPVKVYAHQEASVHDQVPQLLHIFDIPFGVVPGFLTTLVWLDENELLLHGVRGPRFMQGSELVAWHGLDGCQVPLYMHQPIPREMTLKETLAREVVLGRLSAPSLLIDLPDMIAIDDDWMEERTAIEFVSLEEELSKRVAKAPAQSKARLYTNWSYLEGIRAEELCRSNWQAEREALRAEAMTSLAWMIVHRVPGSTEKIWKTILKCQHHDVYCFSAPELREKSIRWLKEMSRAASNSGDQAVSAVLRHVQTDTLPGRPVVVFSSVPHPQTELVEVPTDIQNPVVVDLYGKPIPSGVINDQRNSNQIKFLAHTSGLGYSTYWIQSGENNDFTLQTMVDPLEFANPYYQAVIDPDGTIASLKVNPSGKELIDRGSGPGNCLSATDSSEISFEGETQEERVERYLADPPFRGTQMVWKVDRPASVQHHSLGVTVLVSGRMGDRVQADLKVCFYHLLPRIDFTYEFHFHKASIGTFFDDDSKLIVKWPLAIKGLIHHDIPFGVIREREERPFFPASWVDFSDGEDGLAFFHQGTPSYWVCDSTLNNLLAWGEFTDAIHNGLGRYQWLKSFDQRLDGHHTIHHAVLPHSGDWVMADIPRQALAYGAPPVAFPAEPHPGKLPTSLYILQLTDPAIIATSIQPAGNQISCRVYAAYGKKAAAHVKTHGLQLAGLRLINGDRVDQLAPYQIGELVLEKTSTGERK